MLGTETLDLLKNEQLEKEFTEQMKEQERIAIRAILAATEAQITAKGTELEKYLTAAANDLKDYATEAAAHIRGALEGEAGTAADTHLTSTMQKPILENPVISSGG